MRTKIRGSRLAGGLVSVYVLSAAIVPSDSKAQVAVSSPDIHWTDGQTVVADEEAASTDSVLTNLFAPMGLPAGADVDAMHGLPDGDVLFSLESSVVLGGEVFRPNDVIRFDGKFWTKELDGRASGMPDGVNIDAVAMSGELLLLSLDIASTLGSVAPSDSDIVAYDGRTFSIFLSADAVGIDPAADVDALHLNAQGTFFMSFKVAGQVGGIHYRDEDMLALNDAIWSKEIDNNALSWVPTDLDAWSIVFLGGMIFSDGFELE